MRDKKNQIIAILIALILLVSFKKKPKGIYVPEDGEFHEFGTEGNFDDEPVTSVKTPDFLGSLNNNSVPVASMPIYHSSSKQCGCA